MAQEEAKCSKDCPPDGLHLDESVEPGLVPGDDPPVEMVLTDPALQPAPGTARLLPPPLPAEEGGGDQAVDGDRGQEWEEGVERCQGDEERLVIRRVTSVE